MSVDDLEDFGSRSRTGPQPQIQAGATEPAPPVDLITAGDPDSPDANGVKEPVGQHGAAFLPLHPDALRVALWSGAISFVVWTGLLALPWLLSLLGGLVVFLVASALLFVSILLLAFFCLYWPRVRHRHVFYRVSERGLEIRRGVLWRSHLFIARSRIQHTDVAQGPLQRHLDLGRLIVHTAGTHNASTSLSGIHHREAERIRGLLTFDDDKDGDGV